MRITILDPRPLAVLICLPGSDKFYNWTTQGWETPFNPTAHLLPLAPMEAAPSPFSLVVGADLGPMLERTDAAAIVATTTGAGATLAVSSLVDCFPGPPMELPARYAWQR